MSTIDQYKPCVCGSGKKFKFCKCGATEHVAELEKILKLIEGEQDLAALDRINKQLDKLPSAAWLLAIKAGLLLRMRETGALVEIAQRFLKLKPDNPLALIYRSIAACLEHESIQHQARYLLSGIAECRQVFPDVLGLAIELLTERIANSEYYSMIGVWAAIQDRLLQSDGLGPAAEAADIHLFCKVPNRIVESDVDAPWLERLDEVNALLSIFCYEQAEKKLLSILRDFPNQPEPLSTLLRAQVALLDRHGAVATARKLADHPDLSPEDRDYFQILAWEYDSKPLVTASRLLYGSIDSDEALLSALSELPDLQPEESDESREYMAQLVGDEVPAKRIYYLFQTQKIQDTELRSSAGILVIFGKQTDRPCRVFLSAFDYPPFRPLLDTVESLIGPVKPIEPAPNTQRSYIDFLCRRVTNISTNRPESIDELSARLCEEFLNLPLAVLDGKSPLEASDHPEMQDKLRQLLLHLEGIPRVVVKSSALDEIYSRLGLKPRTRQVFGDEKEPSPQLLESLTDILKMDLSDLSDSSLQQALGLAITLGIPRLQLELGEMALSRPDVIKDERTELTVRSVLLSFVQDPDKRLEHSGRLIELLRSQGQPVGRAVMLHANNLAAAGREAEVQSYLLSSLEKYPDDYELNMIIQQLVTQAQSRSAASSANASYSHEASSAQATGTDADSSLVLPGQSSSQPGESKLWLPGS